MHSLRNCICAGFTKTTIKSLLIVVLWWFWTHCRKSCLGTYCSDQIWQILHGFCFWGFLWLFTSFWYTRYKHERKDYDDLVSLCLSFSFPFSFLFFPFLSLSPFAWFCFVFCFAHFRWYASIHHENIGCPSIMTPSKTWGVDSAQLLSSEDSKNCCLLMTYDNIIYMLSTENRTNYCPL